jgi:hypothetical protein
MPEKLEKPCRSDHDARRQRKQNRKDEPKRKTQRSEAIGLSWPYLAYDKLNQPTTSKTDIGHNPVNDDGKQSE